MLKIEIKLSDRKVAKAQRNKMTRTEGESNNILIQTLKENAENKNTQRSTNNWIKVWKSWASENRHDKHIEEYEPEVLNKIVEELYALRARAIWSLKNLLVLIYSKLHSISCDYLYKWLEIHAATVVVLLCFFLQSIAFW